MKKKFIMTMVLIGIFSVVFGCAALDENEKTKSPGEQVVEEQDDKDEIQAKAEVVYASQIPVIDGEIDECWENAEKLYTDQHIVPIAESDNVVQNRGYVSIMWDEENLYYLGVVDDKDITEHDRINFWIAETCVNSAKNVLFSANPSDGRYYFIATPYNELLLYEGESKPVDFLKDVSGYECKTTRIYTKNGTPKRYVVEMKVPKQSSEEWVEGHLMGFDVSVDTYFTGETARATYNDEALYCCWNGGGAYWNYASALACLKFVK